MRLRYMLDVRFVYMTIGLVMSVVLHELFHAIMHVGDITSVVLFPNSHAIFGMTHSAMDPSALVIEELTAYGISAAVLLITIIDVFAIHDSRKSEPVLSHFEDLGVGHSDLARIVK